jgi:thiol-disulfide isomerase/thioredoxin
MEYNSSEPSRPEEKGEIMSICYQNRPGLMGLIAAMLVIFSLSGAPLQAASRMPDFKLASVTDEGQIDSGNYQGQVLLINFFATWCPPCRYEIPSLIKLQKEFGPENFSVIGISLDQGDVKMVGGFVERLKVNYPVAMGNPEIARGFGGVIGIPASFLVDRQGNIVKSYPGYTEYAIFADDIKKIK